MAAKCCKRCGATKPTALFPRSSRHSDGLFPWCKACKAEDQRARNHRNDPGIVERAEALRAQKAEWAEAAKTAVCECGCGQNPGVYEARGATKGKPRRWVTGHARKGVTLSAEARARITGRPISPVAGEGAIHRWLRKHHPKTGRCAECGHEGKTDYAFQHHPQSYTRDINDYRELCRSCHFRLDEPVIQRGPQLAASATSEQRSAAGKKGAAARYGGVV